MQNGTSFERWRPLKSVYNQVDICPRGRTNKWFLAIWTDGSEFLSLLEQHRLVSDLSSQSELPLEFNGSLMETVLFPVG